MPHAIDEIQFQGATLGNRVLALTWLGEAYAAATGVFRQDLRLLAAELAGRLELPLFPEAAQGALPAWAQALPDRIRAPISARREALAREEPPARTAGRVTGLFHNAVADQGFRVELIVEPGTWPASQVMPPRCGAAFVEAAHRAEVAVLRLLAEIGQFIGNQPILAGRRFSLAGGRAAETFVLDGRSIGAAAAVALFSAATKWPVPEGIALTGEVLIDGTIAPVGQVPKKVEAALREGGPGTKVYVPAGQEMGDERVIPVRTLRGLLEHLFGPDALRRVPSSVVNIEATVRSGIELYEKRNDFRAALVALELALEALAERRSTTWKDLTLRKQPCRREELLCHWRIGSSFIHLGDPLEARRHFEAAEPLARALFADRIIDVATYHGFHGNLAVLLRDEFRFDEARQLLEASLAEAHGHWLDLLGLARLQGNLGELLSFMDRFDEGVVHLEAALESFREIGAVHEVPREHCYLGNLELRRGDLQKSLAHYEAALAANEHAGESRRINEAFIRYGLARAYLRLGDPGRAVTEAQKAVALRPPPDHPGPLALRILGLAQIASGNVEEGRTSLREVGELTYVQGALDRFFRAAALAELGRHLLASSPSPEEQVEAERCLEQFWTCVAETPGLPPELTEKRDVEAALRWVVY